jgi:hypothetical protein
MCFLLFHRDTLSGLLDMMYVQYKTNLFCLKTYVLTKGRNYLLIDSNDGSCVQCSICCLKFELAEQEKTMTIFECVSFSNSLSATES